MAKRIVVALGGNAILTDDPSAQAQQAALVTTAQQLVGFLNDTENQLVVTHGNGPQVGNLLLQQINGGSAKNPAMPLDTVGGMTQGELGFWLSNALNKAFKAKDITGDVATIVTRTVVDAADQAFQKPTKPIGPFYTETEFTAIKNEHSDWTLVEDAGRGYRRVVPSPKPTSIVEANVIKEIVANGTTLVAAGGGGIPVMTKGDEFVGVEAVIDKDFSAAKLAELVDADELVILTAVKNVYIHFNQPEEQKLGKIDVATAKQYLAAGEFAAGSMKPKIEAAVSFVEKTGKRAVITSLDNVENYINTEDGTIIEP